MRTLNNETILEETDKILPDVLIVSSLEDAAHGNLILRLVVEVIFLLPSADFDSNISARPKKSVFNTYLCKTVTIEIRIPQVSREPYC